MSVEAFEILFAGDLPNLLPDEILHNHKFRDVINFQCDFVLQDVYFFSINLSIFVLDYILGSLCR